MKNSENDLFRNRRTEPGLQTDCFFKLKIKS